ncbi:sodium:solute symporter [Halopseudomonas pachastrellae]|nr:sodium:solute symporter [Halopseudomonas pachastrellae]
MQSLDWSAVWPTPPIGCRFRSAGSDLPAAQRRFQATSLVSFLTSNYGRAAALAFSAAILIRLFNEVWSNTAVVGGYYGDSGSPAFIASALLFTAVTLIYSLRGGLRSSILTDAAQAAIFVIALVWVLGLVLPNHSAGELTSTSHWALNAGVDLFLGGLPATGQLPLPRPSTDRPRLYQRRKVHAARVHARRRARLCGDSGLQPDRRARQPGGIEASGNVPAALAKSLGVGALVVMTLVMISAAGSTLDSTFSSLARLSGRELPARSGVILATRPSGRHGRHDYLCPARQPADAGRHRHPQGHHHQRHHGDWLGTGVSAARPGAANRLGFHLSFWTGLALGCRADSGLDTGSWGHRRRQVRLLLGTNLYGLLLCTAGYLLPGPEQESSMSKGRTCPADYRLPATAFSAPASCRVMCCT